MSIIVVEYSEQILFEIINSDGSKNDFILQLNLLLKGNDCSLIYLEDDYSDSEIVSEYNLFYSQTFSKNPRLTKRIHFFRNINYDDNYFIGDEFYIIDNRSFEDSYLGYITIRPFVRHFIIGPSFFRFESLFDKIHVSSKKLINFNGEEILLKGIPFIQQDGHLYTAVESCIWIVLELLSTQSSEFTLEKISKKLYKRDFISNPQNQIGVSADKIQDFFQELGYRCHIYAKEIFGHEFIIDQILFMLDSKMPVLTGFSKDNMVWLVILIGYKIDKKGDIKFVYFDSSNKLINEITVRSFKSLYISLITINPRNLYLGYQYCEPLIHGIEKMLDFDISKFSKNKLIAKSKRFKKYVAFSSMEKDLKGLYINSDYPEDILIYQYYEQGGKSDETVGEIILDATSVEEGIKTCLFAHFKNKLITTNPFDGEEKTMIIELSSNKPYESFRQFDKGEFKIKELPTIGIFKTSIDSHSIKTIISKFKENTVLVLGKDTGEELKLLQRIQKILSDLNYNSIIVKDLDDIPAQSNEEKVRLCAHLSKFSIIENSYPAGQIAELSKICSTSRIVTATLRESGKGSTYMVTDYDIDYNHIKEFIYEDSCDLENKVKDAVVWAEGYIKGKIEYLNKTYYWRK